MIVLPYKRRPAPPTVALLTADRELIDEHGKRYVFGELPDHVRVWCSYDTAHQLTQEGFGEALCWNNEEIRWRHRRFEDGWQHRHSDVAVLRLPFPVEPEHTLLALAQWRDWLAGYGASPTGTTGSASWSLLRATLERPLFTSVPINGPQLPPLIQTLGGRQQLGVHGAGSFAGDLEQLDLPAAYARELGELNYGGRWHLSGELPVRRGPEWWAAEGRPVFVRARVRVPEGLLFGPLPRRPRRRQTGLGARLLTADYPTGGRVQGLWTWQEVEAALEAGCVLEKVIAVHVHLAGQQPFAAWWEAVQAGRRMRGLAGLLAKTTGNALWGRFCMDSRHAGERTIRGRERHGSRRMTARPLPIMGGQPPAHDLAETVSGRVRAHLFRLMHRAGPLVLSVHTDGMWLRHDDRVSGAAVEWRRKEGASRVDLLDPQVLRYWPKPMPVDQDGPVCVFSGVPASLAPERFAEAWLLAGFTNHHGEEWNAA